MARAQISPVVDATDVQPVDASDLMLPMQHLIAEGRGLALLYGLAEDDFRRVETMLWRHYADQPHLRLAVALRFRALIDVFGARRLKELFLKRGFKLIAAAIDVAATQRLNAHFGFKTQCFVLALDTAAKPRAAIIGQPMAERLAA